MDIYLYSLSPDHSNHLTSAHRGALYTNQPKLILVWKALVPLAATGLVTMCMQPSAEAGASPFAGVDDNRLTSFYTVFLALWSNVFLVTNRLGHIQSNHRLYTISLFT